uniref:Pathogenesis-related protein 6 n=1 Tax=Panax ginseng TaxID=4054 RepID=A0A159CHN4_PANGI|nr:pathogenesis-related protein 6 [Panax ginseng]
MEDSCPGAKRSSWPELVGAKGEVAAAVIGRQNPELGVHIVEEGMMVTADFRCDRVRIWVDKYGFVKLVPQIG